MRNKHAFTLIELVLALAVLIIGLVGIVVVIPLGQRSSSDAATITRAAIVASDKLEEVRAYGYENISLKPPPFALTGTNDDISWEIVIDDVLASDFNAFVALPIQNMKKVIVTVQYKMNNRMRTDTFHTFVSKF